MDALRLVPAAPSPAGAPYLPPEAPLAMPVQSLREGARARRLPIASGTIAARRAFVFGVTLLLSAIAAYEMYQVLAVGGLTTLETVILVLFVILFAWIAFSFASLLGGVIAQGDRPHQSARHRHRRPALDRDAHGAPVPDLQRRAASRARARAGDLRVRRRRPARPASSTSSFSATRPIRTSSSPRKRPSWRCASGSPMPASITATARRTMRRRPATSPNGCSASAATTSSMIVLDADSLMTGDTLVRLVAAMERNPGVGLIQTFPVMVNATTPFARVQQFAGRLYGPLIAYGLAWWHGADSNYWGHNAVLRTRAFAEVRRPADLERAAADRRTYPEPRLRRGGADAARRLGGRDGAGAPRLVRRVPALAHRICGARPPLVPGQSAARGRVVRARPALGDAPAPCDRHRLVCGGPAVALVPVHRHPDLVAGAVHPAGVFPEDLHALSAVARTGSGARGLRLRRHHGAAALAEADRLSGDAARPRDAPRIWRRRSAPSSACSPRSSSRG